MLVPLWIIFCRLRVACRIDCCHEDMGHVSEARAIDPLVSAASKIIDHISKAAKGILVRGCYVLER
jgi:hypothetical protein